VIEFSQWVETLISLANFHATMYSSEVVHFAVRGPEICLENLGGNVKFPPPSRKFHHLTRKFWGPKILPLGPEFLPLRLVYIKGRSGVEIPLGISFHPRPSLSPNRRHRLTKDLSGDSLAVGFPGFRRSSLLSAWGFLSSTRFSPWTAVLPQISLPRCLCPSSRFVWVDPFCIERSMF
jgi:hypothetical protein